MRAQHKAYCTLTHVLVKLHVDSALTGIITESRVQRALFTTAVKCLQDITR
jgi:hypothetical protein